MKTDHIVLSQCLFFPDWPLLDSGGETVSDFRPLVRKDMFPAHAAALTVCRRRTEFVLSGPPFDVGNAHSERGWPVPL